MSLVMRKGDGRGVGDGVGVWAMAFKGELDTDQSGGARGRQKFDEGAAVDAGVFLSLASWFLHRVLNRLM